MTSSDGRGATAIDPILVEVIRNRMITAVDDMTATLKRSTYSPLIREVFDFSSTLHDARGDIVATSAGLPAFLGVMDGPVKTAIEAIGFENIGPDDVIISNDPFQAGGTHLNDISIIAPIHAGDRLVMFAHNKAHWQDIGGKEPGSASADATNIFQEGLRLPPVKLVENGVWNEALLATILLNVRVPTPVRGDLSAQMAGCRAGKQWMHELVNRYGWPTLDTCLEEILAHADRRMRHCIAELPDGTHVGEAYVDSDGVGGDPVRVQATVVIAGDRMSVDFTGSDAQAAGSSGNTIFAGAIGGSRLALKCLLDPDLPNNSGAYRSIEVSAPLGTCVNPVEPAPVTIGYALAQHAVIEAVFNAMAEPLSDRVVAEQFGCVQVLALSGVDPGSGVPFVHVMPYPGGHGARGTKDGLNAVITLIDGDVQNVPIEVVETEFPIRVQCYRLLDDSGGAGTYRGGLGIQQDFQLLCDGGAGLTAINKWRIAPQGQAGGLPGRMTATIVDAGGAGEHAVSEGGFLVPANGVVSHRVGGGGGYGDPLERDPEAVRSDVLDDYVSQSAAKLLYGVVLTDDLDVDATATVDLRRDIRASLTVSAS